jgi:hypothetical protein
MCEGRSHVHRNVETSSQESRFLDENNRNQFGQCVVKNIIIQESENGERSMHATCCALSGRSTAACLGSKRELYGLNRKRLQKILLNVGTP